MTPSNGKSTSNRISNSILSGVDEQSTRWSMVLRAHGPSNADAESARRYLVLRYAPAIRSYLLAMTRNEQQAEDIAHDVIVRILQGDFAGVDPKKGLFRSFLKTVVLNMARNTWSKQKRRKSVSIDTVPLEEHIESEPTSVWDEAWKEQLLSVAWGRLKQYEASQKGSVAYSILKIRIDYPDDSSRQLAQKLSEHTGKTIRSDQARQLLCRARIRFSAYLVEEVADLLPDPTIENLQEEFSQLGLLEYVRDHLIVS